VHPNIIKPTNTATIIKKINFKEEVNEKKIINNFNDFNKTENVKNKNVSKSSFFKKFSINFLWNNNKLYNNNDNNNKPTTKYNIFKNSNPQTISNNNNTNNSNKNNNFSPQMDSTGSNKNKKSKNNFFEIEVTDSNEKVKKNKKTKKNKIIQQRPKSTSIIDLKYESLRDLTWFFLHFIFTMPYLFINKLGKNSCKTKLINIKQFSYLLMNE
jgi:hypothetical protein